MKITVYVIFILLISSCDLFKSKNDCFCELESVGGNKVEYNKDENSFGLSSNQEAKIDALVSKSVGVKASKSFNFKYDKSKIDVIYRSVTDNIPELTSEIDIHRGIACALIRINCTDESLTDQQRKTQERFITNDYKTLVLELFKRRNRTLSTEKESARLKIMKDTEMGLLKIWKLLDTLDENDILYHLNRLRLNKNVQVYTLDYNGVTSKEGDIYDFIINVRDGIVDYEKEFTIFDITEGNSGSISSITLKN